MLGFASSKESAFIEFHTVSLTNSSSN